MAWGPGPLMPVMPEQLSLPQRWVGADQTFPLSLGRSVIIQPSPPLPLLLLAACAAATAAAAAAAAPVAACRHCLLLLACQQQIALFVVSCRFAALPVSLWLHAWFVRGLSVFGFRLGRV